MATWLHTYQSSLPYQLIHVFGFYIYKPFNQTETFANESVHTQRFCRGGTNDLGTIESHLMWEELVGPTLRTCDNVEVSTTEALKDKKYVM